MATMKDLVLYLIDYLPARDAIALSMTSKTWSTILHSKCGLYWLWRYKKRFPRQIPLGKLSSKQWACLVWHHEFLSAPLVRRLPQSVAPTRNHVKASDDEIAKLWAKIETKFLATYPTRLFG
jgi:hypothetical protein